jgi:hypothetical protein
MVTVVCITCMGCNSNQANTDGVETTANKYIKGLTAGDIYVPLQEKGFKIDKQFAPDAFFVNCTLTNSENSSVVRVAADSPEKVIEIRASLTDYSATNTNKLASDFLGFIATASYVGSNPDSARQWVVENISHNATTEIGGVTFQIAANAKAIRTLTMTAKYYSYAPYYLLASDLYRAFWSHRTS